MLASLALAACNSAESREDSEGSELSEDDEPAEDEDEDEDAPGEEGGEGDTSGLRRDASVRAGERDAGAARSRDGGSGSPARDAGSAMSDDGRAQRADASPPDAATNGPMDGLSGDSTSACPPGFESQLPLVLTADTVPGDLALGLASAPETPRNPCGLPEEQKCFVQLNAERMAVGREPLIWDGDLVDLARSHAADRSQQRYPGTMHGSSTSTMHLYEQRAQFLGLKSGKFRSVVENAVTGARSAAAAVGSWMGSAGHRAVILGEGAWAPYTHAGCGQDDSQWNIEFGRQ